MRGRISRRAMILIAFVGLCLASYLTYVHYSGITVLCTSSGNPCETVQTSVYSKLAGVPVALLGLIGYISILASLLAPERESTRLATLGITAVGFGFSAYLTGRELFSIHAICEWCVTSACLMTILFALAIWRFLTGGSGPPTPAKAGSEEPGAASDALSASA